MGEPSSSSSGGSSSSWGRPPSKAPRVVRVPLPGGGSGEAYAVAFGARLYLAADLAEPLGVYVCICEGPYELRARPDRGAPVAGAEPPQARRDSVWGSAGGPLRLRACEGRPRSLRRGDRLVAEQVRDGWVRAAGGREERWCALRDPDAGDAPVLERAPSTRAAAAVVPPGWEVLRLQDCSQDVLARVVGGFEWGRDSVAVRDAAAGRFVRIGTRTHGRAGDQLGEAPNVAVGADGAVSSGSCAVLVTRRLVGVSWGGGGDTFDALGLLQDEAYLEAAACHVEVPTEDELEEACREEVQRVLAMELQAWFAEPPPPDGDLVQAAVQDIAALRRLWAGRLVDRRHRLLQACFRQLPRGSEGAPCMIGESPSSHGAPRKPALSEPDAMAEDNEEEDEEDPVLLWVKVALGSVLEMASVMPPRPGSPQFGNVERLVGRAARTLAAARPLSLQGGGPSRSLVREIARAVVPLMETTAELGPVCNELLLAFATATGSSFLAARVVHGLLSGAGSDVARACIPGVKAFWQLGSVLHFEVRDTPGRGAGKPDEHKKPWQFQELEHVGALPAKADRQIRSCLTLPFGEIPAGGVYWEVEVLAPDQVKSSVSLGVWLAHAQHFVACSLADGSAVGLPGARASPAEELAQVRPGSVFGVLLTDEELVVMCDGAPFTQVGLHEMTRSAGAEAAIFIGQGRLSQLRLNIGQRPLRHALAAGNRMAASPHDCGPRSSAPAGAPTGAAAHKDVSSEALKVTPTAWGAAVGVPGVGAVRGGGGPFAAFAHEPDTAAEVAAVLLGALQRNASASVATDGGGSYRFGETHRMQLEPDGMQVKRVNENAWAVVDCELSGADEAEWCFQSIEDLNNDEGTCYGLTTKPPQNSYDRDGWVVIRAYNAHFYVSGTDHNVRTGIQKVHPGSKVHFRLCLSEGALYAWVNDDPPVEMLRDPAIFAGKTWFPGCFVYGSRATIRLISCWKSKTLRRPSSFALECSPRSVELWVSILEAIVGPLRELPRGSAGARDADSAAAQALRVLVAQMQVAKAPWSAFAGVRERLKAQLHVLVIDRRDDPALAQSQVLSCLLVEGLGVGDLWGGPEEVLGVFLRVRGTDSRIEQTLAECLLEQRRACDLSAPLLGELVRVAGQDVLAGQIVLRLLVSSFTDSVPKFVSLAQGVLRDASSWISDPDKGVEPEEGAGAAFFAMELLPVVAVMLGVLPQRTPEALPEFLPLLEEAARVRAALRKSQPVAAVLPQQAHQQQSVADALAGLTGFACGVAALMLQPGASPGVAASSSSDEDRLLQGDRASPVEAAVLAAIAAAGGPAHSDSDAREHLQDANPQLPEMPAEMPQVDHEASPAAIASSRRAATARIPGLRLLRALLAEAQAADALSGHAAVAALLPLLQAALETTMKKPLAGLELVAPRQRRQLVRHLVALLREAHSAVAAAGDSVPAEAKLLGLGMLCAPLPYHDGEELLRGHLDSLAEGCLEGLARPGSFQRAHAAALALRCHIIAAAAEAAQGRMPDGAGDAALVASPLGQLLARLSGALNTQVEAAGDGHPPPRAAQATDPLVVDWDLGAFGRLCPRALDEAELLRQFEAHCGTTRVAVTDTDETSAPAGGPVAPLISRYNAEYFCIVRRATQCGPRRVAIEYEVIGDGSLGQLQDPLASQLAWRGGFALPSSQDCVHNDPETRLVGTLFYDGVPASETLDFTYGSGGYSSVTITLARDAALTTLDEVPAALAQDLALRCPPGTDPLNFDTAAPLRAHCAASGRPALWAEEWRAGASATALMLIRPAAAILAAHMPTLLEAVMGHANAGLGGLTAALAWRLLAMAPAPASAPVEHQASTVLQRFWQLERRTFSAMPLEEADPAADVGPAPLERTGLQPKSYCAGAVMQARRGALALAALLGSEMHNRAAAMGSAVAAALRGEGPAPPTAALLLVGGPWQSPARQLQVVDAPFGRALVVDTQQDHIKVLPLQRVDGTPQGVQRVRYVDLPVPGSLAHVDDGSSTLAVPPPPAHSWGAEVLGHVLARTRSSLASQGEDTTECLRALLMVLPHGPQWDADLLREVVRELARLAGRGMVDAPHEPVALLEHRLVLLRLAVAYAELSAGHPAGGAFWDLRSGPQGALGPSMSGSSAAIASRAINITGPLVPMPPTVSTILDALNQVGWWRGKYKLDMGRNTWHKPKWQIRATLRFEPGGNLIVRAVWKQFDGERFGSAATWRVSDDETVQIQFAIGLPERREAGRARSAGVYVFSGRLVRSRECPIFEGRAEREGDDCKYIWYMAAPDPIRILRSEIMLGAHSMDLPETHSVVSFSVGRLTMNSADLGGPLGLGDEFGSARALATAAVARLGQSAPRIRGPTLPTPLDREIAREDSGSLRDACNGGGDDGVWQEAVECKWTPLVNVPLGGSPAVPPNVSQTGSAHLGRAAAIHEAASFEELRLRQALLVHVLRALLAHRPAEATIASLFPSAAERDAFFKCAALLPDRAAVFEKCGADFASSKDVARDALCAALEAVFAPFIMREVPKVVVQSDHNYHPNEDWLFRLHIERASALRIKFDPRCKTELDGDYLQFFRDEACQERLHEADRLAGDFPAGWPELRVPGDHCWMRFCSNGSQEYWGWKFSMEGVGPGGGVSHTMRFPAALRLLASVTSSAEEAEAMRPLACSALLTIAASVPETPEAVRAIEGIGAIINGHRMCWSDSAWRAALSLLSAAQASNRQPLLGALTELLTSQLAAPEEAASQSPEDRVLLERVEPADAGLLAASQTTVVCCSSELVVCAYGSPIGPGSWSAPAFRIRVPTGSVDTAELAVGVALPAVERSETFTPPVLRELPRSAISPGAELSVFALGLCTATGPRGGSGRRPDLGEEPTPTSPRLILASGSGEQLTSAKLPECWASATRLVPVLQVQGFGGMLTLLPPPNEGEHIEQAAQTLVHFRRACEMLAACQKSGDPDSRCELPLQLVAGAWVLEQAGEAAQGTVADVEELLREKCTSVCESSRPHPWVPTVQRLEVPGAAAIELSFPCVDLAEGYGLRITCDKAGKVPVLATPAPTPLADGQISKYVAHRDHLYASLDNVDPHSISVGTQQQHLALPDGWEIAPSEPFIVNEVIAKHPWGTHVMVCANGNAYSTTLHELGRRAGQLFNSNRLSVQRGHPTKYKPAANQFRILIRRLRPRPIGASPLAVEDIPPGERVIVHGSTVYVHGPVPLAPRWDAPAPEEAAVGTEEGMNPMPPQPQQVQQQSHQQQASVQQPQVQQQQQQPAPPPPPLPQPQAQLQAQPQLQAPHVQQQPQPPTPAAVPASVQPQRRQPQAQAPMPSPQHEASLAPVLCPGPWRWALSSTHSVTVMLQQGGDVKFLKTTLGTLTESELQEIEDLMTVLGEGAVDPNASWIRPDHFRLARATGSWDEQRQRLRLRLEGADEVGTAALSFSSIGEPRREQGGVSVAGEVEHTRWGFHVMEQDSRRAQPGTVSSVWAWPESHEPSLAVELVEESGQEQQLKVLTIQSKPWCSGAVRALFLNEGEWVEEVHGDFGAPGSRLRLQVRTNRGRELSGPCGPVLEAASGRFVLKAPAGCEITALALAATAGATPELVLRPLALVRARHAPAQRLPEAMWEGSMQIKAGLPMDVMCQLTTGTEPGTFEAVVKTKNSAATTEWVFRAGTFSVAHGITATFHHASRLEEPGWEMQGRCVVAEDHHMHLLLFGVRLDDPTKWVRLRLQSARRAILVHHGNVFVDGPTLVFSAADGTAQKYTMHTASSPWTQQVAAEGVCLAELTVQTLDPRCGGRGLILGVGEPRPGGGTAPLGTWPGDRTDRWLWRGDGALSHGDARRVQRNEAWSFDEGDVVGIAVGPREVTFLRNGERLKAVPRAMPGTHGPILSQQTPVFIVGMSCDAVLQLRGGAQYPLLAEPLLPGDAEASDADTRADVRARASGGADARGVGPLPALPGIGAAVTAVSLVDPPPSPAKSATEEDVWVEVTPVGTSFRGSRRLEDIAAGEVLGPGQEVVAAEVVDGWLRVVWGGHDRWLPIEKAGVGRLFRRKADIRVDGPPVFVRSEEARLGNFAGLEPRGGSLGISGTSTSMTTLDLPVGREPFTVEAWVKPAVRKEAVIVAWGSPDQPGGLNELGISASGEVQHCGLTGRTDICDGAWHHVAATFDGKVIRLYVDFTLEGSDEGAFDVGPCSNFVIGAEVPSDAADNATEDEASAAASDASIPSRCFDGSIQKLRIWPRAMAPAYLKAYAAANEGREHEAMAACAAQAVFHALAGGNRELSEDRIVTVLGGCQRELLRALRGSGEGGGKVTASDWRHFCNALWQARGIHGVLRFLQAFSHHLEQRLHTRLELPPEWHSSELLAELQPRPGGAGWRVQGRPAALTSAVLEGLASRRGFEGLEGFRRALRAAPRILGPARCDLAVVELANRTALERGSADECWSEPLSLAEWDKAQPAWIDQALANAGITGGSRRRRLQQALALALSLPLAPRAAAAMAAASAIRSATAASIAAADEAWEEEGDEDDEEEDEDAGPRAEELAVLRTMLDLAPPLAGRALAPGFAALALRAIDAGCSLESCGPLADFLLQEDTSAATPAAAPRSSDPTSPTGRSTPANATPPLAPRSAPPSRSAPAGEADAQAFEAAAAAALEVAAPGTRAAVREAALERAVARLFRQAAAGALRLRFLVLSGVNRRLATDLLPLLDLTVPPDSLMGQLLERMKPLLLGHLKYGKFQQVLLQTTSTAEMVGITINRKAAASFMEVGCTDWQLKDTVYAQVLRELTAKRVLPQVFRQKWQARAFKVTLRGETSSEDAAILYREVLDTMVRELHSRALPLLVSCTAAQRGASSSDLWVLSPRATTPECIQGFEFLGQLLGLALRSGERLQFMLAPFVWKGLVGDRRMPADLPVEDGPGGRSRARSRSRVASSTSSASSSSACSQPRAAAGLRDGGAAVPARAADCWRSYPHQLSDASQLRAVRCGLATIVPLQLLRLWSWRDLRRRACRCPEVDMRALQNHAVYRNGNSADPCVRFFWEAFESLSPRLRRTFVRLAGGRVGLTTCGPGGEGLTIELGARGDHLPPCTSFGGFLLLLPRYSSTEACRRRLLAWLLEQRPHGEELEEEAEAEAREVAGAAVESSGDEDDEQDEDDEDEGQPQRVQQQEQRQGEGGAGQAGEAGAEGEEDEDDEDDDDDDEGEDEGGPDGQQAGVDPLDL